MKQKKIHITSGMKVPEKYFDDFKKNLIEIIEIESVVKNKEGFKIPEAYFEQSKKSILQATTSTTKRLYLPAIRYAIASCLVILLISSVWIYVSQNSVQGFGFSDLTSSEIQDYLNDRYLEDKKYLILEQMEMASLEKLIVIGNYDIENLDDYLQEYDYNLEENY